MIGAGAIVLGDIKIGDGARIGAGSIILQDVGDDVRVPIKENIEWRFVAIDKDTKSCDMNYFI